ncbi:HD family phosphohydrolase [Collibacillus ludicampi]|jgi:putative nucleotidyltransferase with HDIG domain|uniref:HD family phosphohydrolase n=1 Tax=Collibacillus ludicampi TaxID=2771369 RepID=A0AAV4LAC0_9BACL|nr:HDIG domain-containing metalloprotein [Collibacillus ludicampi]GIM44755.1 HD family phosphohydrolase [Collibacillus ludicampi]
MIQSLKRLRQMSFTPKLGQSKWIRATIYGCLLVLLYVLFLGNVTPTQYDYRVGDIALSDIKAPTDAIDQKQTELAREEAARKVPKQYYLDPTVEDKALKSADRLYGALEQVVGDKDKTVSQKIEILKKEGQLPNLSNDVYEKMLGIPPDQISVLHNETNRIIQQFLGKEFDQEAMAGAKDTLSQMLVPLDLSKDARLVIQAVVLQVLQPNMLYDQRATEQMRDKAMREVPEVRINKGELIVKRGQVITEDTLSRLADLKLLSESLNYRIYFGLLGILLFTLAIIEVYLQRVGSKVASDNNLLLLLAIIILLTTSSIKTVGLASSLNETSIGYLAPLAFGTMLVTILFDAPLGVVCAIVFTVLTGLAFDYRFQFLFVGLVSALTGVFAVAKVKHRLVIMRAGFLVAGVNLLAIATVQALLSSTDMGWRGFFQALLFGLVNGLLSAILTIGILPFLESIFGLLTPVSLLELSNPNHPLLRKLLMEAPGTYHHSLIVGNLAETAAEQIGANPLLCRVGAYFHDVGKSKRPVFFIENQMSKENPHDKIAPSLSHLIITSHVRDGLEMQEHYRLPKPIRDICEQHHGTTVLWYFYNKAREQDKSGTVQVDDFRYPGPKPQTKEAAIVMLCDAVEAAVRAMSRPNPNRIEAVIRKIIKDRLNDGQLDECDITLKDLDTLAESFMRTLNGIYHSRIEYPDPPKQS